ncbi:hypothetical protein L7F22_040107 [Adiantum nelumboides]|nr:hypothetical protein [Adiantum nelumboides]
MAMAPQSRGKAAAAAEAPPPKEGSASLKGFVGGVASGLTKLAVGHPFDTIKVRLQCSPVGTYKGPMDCIMQMARRESLLGLYKGASPPAVGWAVADSVLMGSLHTYRLGLSRLTGVGEGTGKRLPSSLHAVAGLGAGLTNSLVMVPIELIKARLQMQQQRVGLHLPRLSSASVSGAGAGAGAAAAAAAQQGAKVHFTGPIDCAMQTIRHGGITALWHALPATLLFRANFAFMFGSYDVLQRSFEKLKGTRYEISPALSTFLAGGLGAEVFWLFAFPFDTVKNRMMADNLYAPRYPTMKDAFRSVWIQKGPQASVVARIGSFYTGFLVCLIRAFPTNAAAIFAFETAMHFMGAEKVSLLYVTLRISKQGPDTSSSPTDGNAIEIP